MLKPWASVYQGAVNGLAIALNQLGYAVPAFALAPPAFDVKHVELALNVTEYDVGPGHS